MIPCIVLFTALYGYLAHQTRRFIYARFGSGWRELISYTAGVLFVFPIAALLAFFLFRHYWDYIQTMASEKAIAFCVGLFTQAYFIAYAPFGIGTFLGWLSDGCNGGEH